MTAIATGNIISAAAVLETHMLTKAVAIMKARINRRALVLPIAATIEWASRRCDPQLSADWASMKPPMNKSTIGSPYAAPTSFSASTPNSGNTANGTSDVAAKGSDSKIHQIAQRTVTAAVMHCTSGISKWRVAP